MTFTRGARRRSPCSCPWLRPAAEPSLDRKPLASIGPASSSPRSRPAAIATSRRSRTTCAKDAPPRARPNTSAIASWRGRASPTTRATTPWRNRRPRASRRCSPTIRRRCCSAGTCSTRCTASARRRRSRDAWSTLREFVLDYGLLGDALMEQGRLAEAAQAYQKMIDLKPFYQSYTRAAHLRWLRGDLAGAIDLMRAAVKAASPRDPESIAWAVCAARGLRAPAWPPGCRRADGRRVAAVRARLRRGAARPRPHPARAEAAGRRRRDADARGAPQSAARIPVGARRRASPAAAATDEAAALEQPAGAGRQPRRSAHARALPLHATRGRRQGSGPRATRAGETRGHLHARRPGVGAGLERPDARSLDAHGAGRSPKAPRTDACSSTPP